MKALIFLTLALAAVSLRGQVEFVAGGRAAGNKLDLTPSADSFSLIGADYKKPQELPENFFNPFKSQAAGGDLARKEAATVSNESVTNAIGLHGVHGIVYSPDPRTDRIVLGDQVFAIGDELAFPDGDKSSIRPLVSGASVVLREVRQDNLQFDIVPEGEVSRRLVFPLRGFWRD